LFYLINMKYKILFFVLSTCIFSQFTVTAQNGKSYKVQPGQKVTQTIPFEAIYEYPEFEVGTAQFRNGKAGMGKMNYNRLLREIEFINDKLDTTALDDAGSMNYITMVKDTFYFDKVYVKQMNNRNGVKLAESKSLQLSNRQKIGGFGEINGGTVESKEQVSSNANMVKTLVAKEILTFTEYRSFYFGDRFNHFKQASRKNVLDMFGKAKPGLEKYLDDSHLNYFDETDMKKLAAFLQE
jgi:hypothetical protein